LILFLFLFYNDRKQTKDRINIYLQYCVKFLIKLCDKYYKFIISIADENIIFIRLTFDQLLSYKNLFFYKNKENEQAYSQISNKIKSNAYHYHFNNDKSIF